MNLGDGGGDDWFVSEVSRRLGDGMNTSFWSDNWHPEGILHNLFPRLFVLSTQKNIKVGELWNRSAEGRNWEFTWRRSLFEWESVTLQNLLRLLEGVTIGVGSDEWRWHPGEEGVFTVKSCYTLIEGLWSLEEDLNGLEKVVFGYLWKSRAPSKVLAFIWATLLNRIPTRVNLAARGVLGEESSRSCVLCGVRDETEVHLFLHCEEVQRVWKRIMCWLHCNFIIPNNLLVQLECWSKEVSNKKLRQGFWLIWYASLWVIWIVRNDIIFNNGTFDVDEVVEKIKVISWS